MTGAESHHLSNRSLQAEATNADTPQVIPRGSKGPLLGLGLLAASIAYSALSVELTVLDAHRLSESAEHVLAAAPVRRALTEQLGDSIARSIGNFPSERATIDAAATDTLRDPRFRRAFAGALLQLHARLFDESGAPVILDTTEVAAAVHDTVARRDPALARRIPPDSAISVTVPSDNIPDLSWMKRDVEATARLATLAAFLLVTAGIALHVRPAWAIAKIGRWCITVGTLQLVLFLVVPRIVLPGFGDGAKVAAAVVDGITTVLVLPAVLLVSAGIGAVFASITWQRRATRRTQPPTPTGATAVSASPKGTDLLPGTRTWDL